MKPINPLKPFLKASGVLKRAPKVEGSDLVRKPVNKAARIVTAKRPYWADPPVEQRPSISALETTITKLKDELTAERRLHAKQVEKSRLERERLQTELESALLLNKEVAATASRLRQENEQLSKAVLTLSKSLL